METTTTDVQAMLPTCLDKASHTHPSLRMSSRDATGLQAA